MHFTVRHTVRVAGTRRTFRSFVRPEHAINTSLHADRFDTIEAAEMAADRVQRYYEEAGHVVTVTDYFKVQG